MPQNQGGQLKLLILIIPFIVGAILPVQGGVNNLLSKALGNPIPASFVSFLGGTLVLGLILLFSSISVPEISTLKTLPIYYWIGGLLGAMFVTSLIIIAPITGTVTFFSISLGGQFFMGILIDHFGWFDITKHEVNPMKIGGILLIFLGVAVIQYSKN